MVVSRTHIRLLCGLAIAVLLSATLTFIGFASPFPREGSSSGDEYDVDVALLQHMGMLTVKGGVTVNGNPANTGRTILSNDKIVTDSDGVALVELGPLGSITIGESTTVTLVFTREWVNVESECKHTRIWVVSGQVEVQSPRSETLGVDDSKRYRGSAKATSRRAVFEIRCVGRRLAALRRPRNGILAAALALPALISELRP